MTPTAEKLSEQDFDRIVGGFYDAATGGREWTQALEPLHRVFDAHVVVLHTMDLLDGRMLSLHTAGPVQNRTVLEYMTNWEQHDPRKHRALQLGQAGIGRWAHCHDAFDEAFVERNPFYRHFWSSSGARFNSNVVLPIDERTVIGLVLELDSGRQPLNADERALAQRFGHHVEQALHAHERIRQLASQALVGHQVLSGFAFPMWLLDTERRVLFANAAAGAMLGAAGETLHQTDGRLRLADAQADRQLTAELHRLASCPHFSRSHVRLGGAGALPEDAAWLHLAVLEPRQVMGLAFGQQRCLLATLFDTRHLLQLDPYALGQMFDLTPTQARVAALLGEGLEPQAIAQRLNVKLTTVRSHVRAVLQALGQSRVTDVVRVLSQGAPLWSSARTP